MKKILFTLVLFFTLFINVNALELNVNSKNVLLYDLTNDNIIYSKNDNERVAIASLTKIMTALTAIDYINDLNTKVTIKSDDFVGLKEQNAALAGFYIGEVVTYKDLLYGLLLPSGAEAALALVNNTYKTETLFIDKMNEKVKEIGLENTNFTTVSGLDTYGNYSTVSDLLKLIKYALKNNTFYEIYTAKEYRTSDRMLSFESTLKKNIKKYNLDLNLDYIIGSKTGTTSNAGLCMVSLAKHNSNDYILITTGAPLSYTKPYNIYDAEEIYSYFFDNYEYRTLFDANDEIIKLKVDKSLEKNIVVKASDKVYLYINKNIDNKDFEYKYNTIESLNYKTKVGSKIGTLDIVHEGKVLKTLDIFLNEKIHYNYFKIIIPITVLVFMLLRHRRRMILKRKRYKLRNSKK